MKMHHMRKPKMKGRPSRPPSSGTNQDRQYTGVNEVGRIDSRCRHNVQYLKQFVDKFNNFARESISSGDRVSAESFYQHADHYQRILNERLQDRLVAEKTQREVVEVPDESRNAYPIDAASATNSTDASDEQPKPAVKSVARAARAARIVE
jgi:hypothetical protein